MKNMYKITIAYDGSNYCGWQLQKNGVSIHEKLQLAAEAFLGKDVRITGCSRTDSGVHALAYVASVLTDKDMPERRLISALNAHLPKDIVVHECQRMDEGFHPRYHAKAKHYRYTIYNYKAPIPQYLKYAYYYRKKMDLSLMQEASKYFEGNHDFVAFSSIKTKVNDTVRTVYSCQVTQEGDFIHIDVKGNGFLYNMVRIIAGKLIEVGLHKVKPEDIPSIIKSKDRQKAKLTAPAKGLTLVAVDYAGDYVNV